MTFGSIKETRALAEQANAAGPFQTVIHNAGIFRPNAPRLETVDGLEDTFAVNALAPYVLTALIATRDDWSFYRPNCTKSVNRT